MIVLAGTKEIKYRQQSLARNLDATGQISSFSHDAGTENRHIRHSTKSLRW